MLPFAAIDTGDTAWVLASAALVLLMTPGLALFYGGMVRAKSVINMMLMSLVSIAVVSAVWVLYGYALAFGDSGSSWVGSIGFSDLAGLLGHLTNNGGQYPVPELAFSGFQLMFAIITVALISGAVADRARFAAWSVFVAAWVTFVYFPIAHWVFDLGTRTGSDVTGEGILAAHGLLDFAGGTAVEINAGVAGLAMAVVVGRRVGFKREPMRPHSIPLVVLGTGLLWFGWLGFNAGSALGANDQAALILMNTQVSGAAAVGGWLLVERFRDGHPTGLGAASGAVAGLVAITPSCAYVTPVGALLIGVVAGVVCAFAIGLKYKFNFDDSLDLVGVHLVGGIWGTLAIGIFGTLQVNANGADGLLHGGGLAQFDRQLFGAAAVLCYSLVVTSVIAIVIDRTMGFRIDRDAEIDGIDFVEHAETAYELDTRTGSGRFSGTHTGHGSAG